MAADKVDTIKVLRDQVIFLGAFVIIFGLVETDVYYSQFGLRYQNLDVGYQHILYRGATLVYFEPTFIFVFGLLSLIILVSNVRFTLVFAGMRIHSTFLLYGGFVAVAAAGVYLSFQTGINLAVADMYPTSTTLRRLVEFHSEDNSKKLYVNNLLADKQGIVLIAHRTNSRLTIFLSPIERATRPRVVMHQMSLSGNDFYSDGLPRFR